jgi:hypothetical protein
MAAKYKLNVARDVDSDEPGNYILNLPAGWQFAHDPLDVSHVRGYDTMRELRADARDWVVPCACAECLRMIARANA